ncbi:MAG: hypothetical protein JWQ09_522, partial [Segetibacter sp.]|nr:hypothetical protein [Segetibacter sp.]
LSVEMQLLVVIEPVIIRVAFENFARQEIKGMQQLKLSQL